MGNFTLGRYLPLDSPIHRMDPRAKIMGMLLMLIAIFIPSGWIGYGIIFVCAAGTILLARLQFGFILKSMRPMMIMMIFLFVINCLVIHTGEVLFTIIKVPKSRWEKDMLNSGRYITILKQLDSVICVNINQNGQSEGLDEAKIRKIVTRLPS